MISKVDKKVGILARYIAYDIKRKAPQTNYVVSSVFLKKKGIKAEFISDVFKNETGQVSIIKTSGFRNRIMAEIINDSSAITFYRKPLFMSYEEAVSKVRNILKEFRPKNLENPEFVSTWSKTIKNDAFLKQAKNSGLYIDVKRISYKGFGKKSHFDATVCSLPHHFERNFQLNDVYEDYLGGTLKTEPFEETNLNVMAINAYFKDKQVKYLIEGVNNIKEKVYEIL